MNFRVIGFVCMIVGIVLLVFGILATQKAGEQIVEGLTGHFTDTTMWYIIGGIVLLVGGWGLTRIRK